MMSSFKNIFKFSACIFAIVHLNVSCIPKNKTEDPLPNTDKQYKEGMWIVNEGNFQWGYGSLTFVTPDSKIEQEVYHTLNNEYIGNVLQSMTVTEEDLFLIVNNSQKIIQVDAESIRKKRVVSGFSSPRYMTPPRNGVSWVSDLYSKTVQRVDWNLGKITDFVSVNARTEQIFDIDTEILCASINPAGIIHINSIDNSKTFSPIPSEGNPFEVKKSTNNHLYILQSDAEGRTDFVQYIYEYDPSTKQFVQSFALERAVVGDCQQLVIDEKRDRLYVGGYTSTGEKRFMIHKFKLSDFSASIQKIADLNVTAYELTHHPTQEELFISDAKDFVQGGEILRISASSGAVLERFPAGVIPSEVHFVTEE